MNTYIKIGLKFLLLSVILICLNFIYKYTFLKSDIQKYSEIINKVTDAVNKKCELVYLGESSNIASRSDDSDQRTISEFIGDYFPSKKLGSITYPASHANIFYALLKNIPDSSTIKTIIVTLNLRSFDAGWIYSPLETPLQKSIVMIKNNPPLVNRFKLAFKCYDMKSEAEREKQLKKRWREDVLSFPFSFKYNNVIDWDRGVAMNGIKNPDGTRNDKLTELACHYVKTYAFQIDTVTNPRITDFDNIKTLAKKRNWNLIFNLLGENTEMADSLVGPELLYLMKQNRDLLVKRYYKDGVIVVDNLEAIHTDQYIDQNWTTEHYAEQGRKIIAAQVANCLRKFYPDSYVDLSNSSGKPAIFFNDCEGNDIWAPMQTITNEKAFSGEKSSKIWKKQEYSITFERQIKKLPDSISQLFVDLRVFQSSITHDAKLVIEISGEKVDYQWMGYKISNFTHITDSWQQITQKVLLPTNFRSADLIKVYVLNLSNDPIYIDDFSIKFEK